MLAWGCGLWASGTVLSALQLAHSGGARGLLWGLGQWVPGGASARYSASRGSEGASRPYLETGGRQEEE